jgi:hypothetical protein
MGCFLRDVNFGLYPFRFLMDTPFESWPRKRGEKELACVPSLLLSCTLPCRLIFGVDKEDLVTMSRISLI